MAAHPDLPSRAARAEPRETPFAITQIGAGVVGIACLAAGIFVAQAYPLGALVAIVPFTAWFLFAALRFSWAWPCVPALLPIVDLTPRTGWMTFEEFDLLVLATLAGGYLHHLIRLYTDRHAPAPRRRDAPALSILAIALLLAFLIASAISMMRGFDQAGGFVWGWYQGINDPLNSLRIFKSYALALLAAPLVVASLRSPRGFDRFGLGMTAGLAIAALAVVQERLLFTGLLDFSSDYRVTGSFWEMHLGGAALDGFLAISIPFAAREAFRKQTALHFALVGAVLALGAYASLVSFSRGVYAAVPLSLVVAAVLIVRQGRREGRAMQGSTLVRAAILVVTTAALGHVVFREGGYRAVLAVLGVLATAIPLEASLRRTPPAQWVVAAIVAVVVGGIGAFAADVVPKGAYLIYGVAFAAAVAALVQADRAPNRMVDLAAIAAVIWLAISACLVSRHWSGQHAFAHTALAVVLVLAATFAARFAGRRLWPEPRRDQLAALALAAVTMGAISVFSAGAYMGNRFAGTTGDFDARLSHWREGLDRMRGAGDWTVGVGLGRYPASSLYDAAGGEFPGSFHYNRRDGAAFVTLTAPRIKYLSWGEYYRLSQRVDLAPGIFRLRIQVRSTNIRTGLQVEICEKQLLYNANCAVVVPNLEPSNDWQTLAATLDTRLVRGGSWVFGKPLFFAIAATEAGAIVDVRKIELLAPDGTDMLVNGDFGDRTARWFSSSDKHHLPYHMKNMVLGVLFDQGLVGVVLFGLVVGGALLRTSVGRARLHPDAPFVAAALVGFLVVGAFDTLLDVPRLAFLFYVVAIIGLALRSPRVERSPPAPPAAPVAAPPEPSIDEKAARALRRQRAFGERRTRE